LIFDGWSTLRYVMWFRRVPEDSPVRYLRKLFLPIVYNGLSATIFCVTRKIVHIATSHTWLKRLKTKIATLAMITRHRQTYASHIDFDSFKDSITSISILNILKGSLEPKLKAANVWPFNARGKVARG